MGYGFEVFFVEMDRIKGLCGGNDRELEAAIVEKQGYEDHLLALDPPVYGDEAQRWRRALRRRARTGPSASSTESHGGRRRRLRQLLRELLSSLALRLLR